MSSQESREARQQRQAHGARAAIDYRNRSKRKATEEYHAGPTEEQRRHEKWSDDYEGEDPHDDEYFQDNVLDFHGGE